MKKRLIGKMKILSLFFLSLFFMVNVGEVNAMTTGKVSPCDSYGDINLDGYITTEDSSLVADNITGEVFLGTYEAILADVNNDGSVNIGDLSAINFFIAGNITTFPVCFARSIKVISPNNGEEWGIGDTYDIIWRANEFSDHEVLIVSLVNDELGKTCRLIDGYVNANEGKYSWKIGTDNCSAYYGDKLKIRIGESEKGSNWLYLKDDSDNYFSIITEENKPICGNGTCESGESLPFCREDCKDWEKVFDTQECVTWHASNVFNYSPCGHTKIYNVIPGNLLKLAAYGDNCASCVCYHVNFDLYDYINNEWVKIKTVDKLDEKTGIKSIFDYIPKSNQIKIVGTNGCFHFNLYQKKNGEIAIDNNEAGSCLIDGTLIKLPGNPKIYIIRDCKRYWIRTAEEFRKEGYKWENVKITTDDELNALPEISTPNQEIKEGAIIRVNGDDDIYIVKYIGNKKFKRLILNPSVFNSYGHLRWKDVVEVEKETVDSFTTSNLVRNARTGRIYRLTANGDSGVRRHFRSISAMQKLGHDLDAVYEINETDENSYEQGDDLE